MVGIRRKLLAGWLHPGFVLSFKFIWSLLREGKRRREGDPGVRKKGGVIAVARVKSLTGIS